MAENLAFSFLNDDEDEDGNNSFNASLSDPTEDDYYACLNLPRDAGPDDITAQYRKLSRIYHPDKHQDPESKVNAERLFGKLKLAYEVLMDPERRAIYDTLGSKGLNEAQKDGPTGMELITRYRTPMEIREEYERLQRDKEERMMEKMTNPKGAMTVNINASELFTTYDADDEDDYYSDAGPYIELTGFHFHQSIEAQLNPSNTMVFGGSVSAENGRGKGNINVGWRKSILNYGWGQATIGKSTNGMNFSLTGRSALRKNYFVDFVTNVETTNEGVRPGMMLGIGKQFDDNANGTLTWRAGALGGLTTQYQWGNSVMRYVAQCHLGVVHSHVQVTVARNLEERKMKLKGVARLSTLGFLFEYGVEKRISPITSVSAVLGVGLPVGVILRLRVSRSNQSYIFPIHLCDQVLPAPVLYGTITPVILWVIANKLLIEPYERERTAREKAKTKAQYKAKMAEKKAEADAAIQLMKNQCARIVAEEETKRGLIISSAKYGVLVSDTSAGASTSASASSTIYDEIIDVTIPLQCQVKDSKLILHNSTKAQLLGFYDPAPGEEKSLMIQYLFQRQPHEVVVQDQEPITIPKGSHRVQQPT